MSGLLTLPSDPRVSIYYTLSEPVVPNGGISKPVIALSNSLAASTMLWDNFATCFSPHYIVLRYDSRFHGQSPLASGLEPAYDYAAAALALTIGDLADDLMAVLDHVGVEKLHALIGLSIGGGVALAFGARYRERVKHVVVVGTKAKTDVVVNATFDSRLEFARVQGTAALATQSVGRWFDEDWIVAHADEARRVETMVAQQSLEGYEVSMGALKKLDLWPYVEQIREQINGESFLFVAGERDGSIPQEMSALAERAGGAYIALAGLGHMVNIENPQIFHELVRSNIGPAELIV
jgi:pimeloyl-ACP methyl ester carboxylesterase